MLCTKVQSAVAPVPIDRVICVAYTEGSLVLCLVDNIILR